MKYVRVRDRLTGHEFSEPEGSALIGKRLEVVSRKGATNQPLPPKSKIILPPAGKTTKEAN